LTLQESITRKFGDVARVILASGYGSPQIFSSFEWETRDDSPTAKANGLITNADCTSGKWTCDHRNRGIVAMVKWHNYVGNAKRANFYTDDANVIAMTRIPARPAMVRGVVVTGSGLATVTVGAKDAVAITRADRISSLN
jgi:hypothetical protein